MDKKGPVVIWKNGKQEKIKQLESTAKFNIVSIFNRRKKRGKKKARKKKSNSLVIAVCSAIIIGLMLGFSMLFMMKNMNETNVPIVASADKQTEDEEDPIQDVSTFTLEQMDAFVIQAGMFSELDNAEEWTKKFTQAGLNSVIWERDENFFILVGLATSMDEAKELLKKLKHHDFEMFVKEWSTESIEIELTEEESDWLTKFQSSWHDSVENNQSSLEYWKEQVDLDLTSMNHETKIVTNIHSVIIKNKEEFEKKALSDYVLLELWQEYDRIAINPKN